MYKPLPNGLTIKESKVQGMGLFATKDFDADVVLGIVHILNKNFLSNNYILHHKL